MSTNSDEPKIKSLRQRFVLKVESPLALLRTRASTQFAKSLDYLPGSALRGAFAEIFLNKKGSADPLFQKIFVQQQIRFHDFLPSFDDQPSFLLPLSASACKRHKLEHAKSLKDRLVEVMAGVWHKDDEKKCDACHGDLDRVNGYIQMVDDAAKQIAPKRQLRMHVGISRARGAAQHGQLFSYDMLTQKHFKESSENATGNDSTAVPRLAFVGELESVADEGEAIFAEFMQVIGRDHLSVGKARTRGLGELSVAARTEVASEDDFDARWRAFNNAVLEHGQDGEYCYFSITLKSHLILRDVLGLSILGDIQAKNFSLPNKLATELKLPEALQDAERRAAFLNYTTVSGWNAAQGLPKADVPALARGSVLGFREKKENETTLKQQLKILEITGLGERRAEGLGQITVCDPFHVEFS